MKIKRMTEKDGHYHEELRFYCPGCKEFHYINDDETKIKDVPVWGFNKNYNSPTISPSILVQWPGNRCHSFIRDGKIEYLSDCTHELAGKTIELPNIDENEK